MRSAKPFRFSRLVALVAGAAALWGAAVQADPAPSAAGNGAETPVASDAITVTGQVPDQATKAALLAKLREVYGASRVVDAISVGGVSMPANWAEHAAALITPDLRDVKKGELRIDGNTVSVKGDVSSQASRDHLTSQIASALNPTYVVKSQLRVAMAQQSLLDNALANRIVEFDSGSAHLTAAGQGILDEMAGAMTQLNGRKVEIIGHTDSVGNHDANVALSKSRADAVKDYLVRKGIAADMLVPIGMGPDRPVAPNDSDAGRRRNRRIEFNLSQ